MLRLDCFFGVDSKEMFGINKYRLELYPHIKDASFSKKKIAHKIPDVPFLKRYLNFFDFLSVAPLHVLLNRRKGSCAFITSHSEAYLLNYFRFRKSVVLCYDLVPLLYGTTGLMSRLKLKFALRGMKKADAIMTISDSVKKDVIKYLGYPEEDVFPIYGGINPSVYKVLDGDLSGVRRKYGIPEGKKVILFVAAEEPRKNLPVLLRAMAKLKRRFPDVVLLKVGKPRVRGVREGTMKLIRDLGLEGEVIFTDYLPEGEIPKIFNIGDVMAYPTEYVSGISLPLMEAMACGCPVVSTKYVKETCGDSPAVLEDPKDVDALEGFLFRVFTDGEFRKSLVDHGFRQSRKFYWENTGRQATGVLKKVFWDSPSQHI